MHLQGTLNRQIGDSRRLAGKIQQSLWRLQLAELADVKDSDQQQGPERDESTGRVNRTRQQRNAPIWQGLRFPNKLNGGDARLDSLKPTWLAASASEEPTSDGPGYMSKPWRRRETGTQTSGAGDRREDSDRKRCKTGASEAATESVATGWV